MKQDTAVTWLINELHKKQQGLTTTSYNHIFDKAKDMEKNQIIEAFCSGDNSDCTSEQNSKEFAEKYYNQTYTDETT